VTDAVAFAFERLTVARSRRRVVVQAYLALTPNQVRIWTRDESAPAAAPLVELVFNPPIVLPKPADEKTQLHTSAVAGPGGGQTLRIAVGGGKDGSAWRDQVESWLIDIEAKTSTAYGPYAAPKLTAFTVGAFGDRAVLFVAGPDGIACRSLADTNTAPKVLEYQPGTPTALRLAFGVTSSRHILAAVLQDKSVRVWDAEQGRILRTLDGLAGLLYVGQGKVGGRLAAHLRKCLRPGHRQGGLFGKAGGLESSWILNPSWFPHQRLELENDLIAAHFLVRGEAPPAQFLGDQKDGVDTEPAILT
jgi:hypothetical protein